jgi:hypothetical protein
MPPFYHHPTMRPCPSAVLVAFALLLTGGVGSAQAAQISVNRSCFADPADRQDTVIVRGSGFAPNAPYRVLLDGKPLPGGSGRTDVDGRMSGRFVAPGVGTVSRTSRQHTFDLRVRQDGDEPAVYLPVSRLLASFSPARGDPRRLKVRFSTYGFSLTGQRRPPIYVHYVSPRGHLARTVRLGRGTGSCGFLRTGPRRLFAFDPARGNWRLQFDTRRRYSPGTSRSSFLFYTLPVHVR